MAGGGPVTGFLAARAAAAAALLAGHHVDVAAAEGGGGGEGGGIADVPVPRDRKVTLVGVEVEVGVTGEKAPGRSLGVVPEVVVALAPKVTSKKAKNRINFSEQKTQGLFTPRCQLIPSTQKGFSPLLRPPSPSSFFYWQLQRIPK